VSRKRFPFLIVLQSNFLESLVTVVVAPVALEGDTNKLNKLNPVIVISGKRYRALMPEMAGILRNRLGEVTLNVSDQHAEFIAAVDMVFKGI
jgi:toxin CcdB